MGSMERRPYSYAGFFLYDCYPFNEQVINEERTQANIQKRAPQWEVFLEYWEGKGKLQPNPIEPVTYIKDPTEVTHNEGAVYDLSGRKSNGLKKGLYIQNGRKVMK